MNKLFVIGSAALLVMAVVFGMMYVSYTNQEQQIRNSVPAETDAAKIKFDTMTKTLRDQFHISDKYSEDFKEVFVEIMEKRHAAGGSLAKFVTEANPNFDSSLLKNLQAAIESKRGEFEQQQKKLRDLQRQHDDLRTTIPGKWFVGGVDPIEVQLVTSTQTEEVYSTGVDDSDPFAKPKEE